MSDIKTITVNGTQYDIKDATARAGVSDLNSAFNVIAAITNNLANIDDIIIGQAWNLNTNANRAVLYIPVSPSTTYTISYNSIANFDQVGLYEKNEKNDTTSITGSNITTSPKLVTTNSSTNYLVVQFNKTNISKSDFSNTQIQCELGDTQTPYTPHYTAVDRYARQEIEPINDVVFSGNNKNSCSVGKTNGSVNIPYTMYTGKYLGSNGEVKSTTNNNYLVYKFPVTANTMYCIYGTSKLSNSNSPMASFSQSDIDASTFEKLQIIISNVNAGVIRYRELTYTPEYNGYIYIAGYVGYGTMSVAEAITQVGGMKTGFKMQLFGDSITDDSWGEYKYTWATDIVNYVPVPITVVNSAVGGSRIIHGYTEGGKYSEKTDGNNVYDLITDGTLDSDNDVVIIFAGTNDFNSAIPFGTWDDTDNTHVIPALKAICEYVTTNTNSLLLICTPINRYNSTDASRPTDDKGVPLNTGGKTLRDYCDVIIDTCNFYGVPVIDTNYNVGFTRQNISRFTDDGLHPNPQGAKIIAKYLCGILRRHFAL